MILGVVFGTFSSLFVAAPVAYVVMGNKLKNAKPSEDEAAPSTQE